MSVIAIFGGTFNPFHIGHYEMLKSICEKEWIDEVLVMPDRIPPHKNCDFLASDEERIAMCSIACEDFPKAKLCLIEFEREGKSYTIDTIRALKQIYPNDTFYFVCGGDMIASLDTWKSFNKLIKETKFIGFNRDNSHAFFSDVERMRKLGADISVISDNITNISSTDLRKNLDRKMLPIKVYEYIISRKMYNE